MADIEKRFVGLVFTVAMIAVISNAAVSAEKQSAPWKVALRTREKVDKSTEQFRVVEIKTLWNPTETAIVIVDMWDDHHCDSAARRVGEMAPFMNRVVGKARERGVLIIHAPSSCSGYYKGTPARNRAVNSKPVKAPFSFQWNYFNPEHEGPLATKLEAAGCSCDTDKPCHPDFRAWERQIAAIKIDDSDAVTDDGQEVYNLLQGRNIKNVIVMGVHTNRCVLGRPFGIRQMVYLGKNVVLCRDLTDSYHRDPGKHFEGLQQIIAHVEKYWCPTITSTSITGQPEFRFAADKTKTSAIQR